MRKGRIWKKAVALATAMGMIFSFPIVPAKAASEWDKVWAAQGKVVYDSTWTLADNEGENGIILSSTKDAKATLYFYGTGIKWIGQKDTNFGTGAVFIDDELVSTVNVHSDSGNPWQVEHFKKEGLEKKTHKITISPTGEGGEGVVDIESFEVYYDKGQKSIPAEFVSVTSKPDELKVGENGTVKAIAQPYNATEQITYESANKEVATVDANTGVVTAVSPGEVTIKAKAGSKSADVSLVIKQEDQFTPAKLRKVVDSKNPLFIHHLYRQGNTKLPGPLQGGKDIQGFWDSLVNGDENGRGISKDLLENQAIVIHASGSVKGVDSTLAWYEEQFKKTKKDSIPFYIMVSNSGTSDGGTYNPPSIAWCQKIYNEYPNMLGVLFSENHNATQQWMREARMKYMKEQVILAAKNGGHVVYSDMNDAGDYVEVLLSNQALFDTLKQYKENFILLAKTTSAWSKVSYNSHESVAQGAWLADIAGNWGSLIDSWMWFIEYFGPVYGDETFSVVGGAEECRGPVSFPELFYEMRMNQQARVGATVFTFEHPDYTTSIGKENGTKNLFTPVFTESIVKSMEYMKEYKIPTKEEVLKNTKVAYCAEKGTLNDLANDMGFSFLDPLYGDKNHNGYNNTTMMTYKTGRYGTIPSLPKLATAADKAQFEKVFARDTVKSELKNKEGIKNYFDNIYPETYQGEGFAQRMDNTWYAYNNNWNIDSRVEAELHANQNVSGLKLDKNLLTADITFQPYTTMLLDDENEGKVKVKFNNYFVDKNEIWKDYNIKTTKHWDSDNDTGMYDYLLNQYIPQNMTKDDIYRQASLVLKGVEKEPKVVMVKELTNPDGTKQCKPLKTSYNAQDKTFTVNFDGNGWQEFELILDPADVAAANSVIADISKNVVASQYTAESYKALDESVKALKALMEKEGITQKEIDDAVVLVKANRAKLAKVQSSQQPPITSPNPGKPNPEEPEKPVARVTLSSVKNNGKKKVTIRWKKANDVSGYMVYRSTKKNKGYKLIKTLNSAKVVKLIDKKVKKNKKYFYKVCAYRMSNGKKVTGKLSKIKAVTVKK